MRARDAEVIPTNVGDVRTFWRLLPLATDGMPSIIITRGDLLKLMRSPDWDSLDSGVKQRVRDLLGLTAQDYKREQRYNRALMQLSKGSWSDEQIAEQIDISSRTLHRAFPPARPDHCGYWDASVSSRVWNW